MIKNNFKVTLLLTVLCLLTAQHADASALVKLYTILGSIAGGAHIIPGLITDKRSLHLYPSTFLHNRKRLESNKMTYMLSYSKLSTYKEKLEFQKLLAELRQRNMSPENLKKYYNQCGHQKIIPLQQQSQLMMPIYWRFFAKNPTYLETLKKNQPNS